MKGEGTPDAGSTRTMPVTDCRHFSGYKPCGKSETCDTRCSHLSIPSTRVLIVHLEALGAVLRSTALLPAIRRKFPGCHITWVTQKPADQLLMHNPMIDRVLTTSNEDLLALSALEFDVAFSVDKGLKSTGVLKQTHADLVYGFQVDPRTGAVLPVNQGANELWQIGLSNHKKFYVNEKPETRLAHEALELGPWMRDPYVLELSANERQEAAHRRETWARPDQIVVGLNTGCSANIPYKKLSIEVHRELIERLLENSHYRVVLLGGREDTLRNQRIAHGLNVVQSPTEAGLRDGIVSVEACDIVVTGDSLGMHIAIALGKWTVAWFGPTCAHEIDLYDRGVHVLTEASCSPCWKRSCDRNPMCYDLVSVDEVISGVLAGEEDIDGPLNETLNKSSEDRSIERSRDDFGDDRKMRFGPPSQMVFEITEAIYEEAERSQADVDDEEDDDGYAHVTLEVVSDLADHMAVGRNEKESEFETCLEPEENHSHSDNQGHGPREPNI